MKREEPVYVSKPHRGSWGQEYRIYGDRLELRAKILFCTLRIPLSNIEEIKVKESRFVWSDLYRRPLEFWWTYNNDRGGEVYVHLRRKGWPSRISLTAPCSWVCLWFPFNSGGEFVSHVNMVPVGYSFIKDDIKSLASFLFQTYSLWKAGTNS